MDDDRPCFMQKMFLRATEGVRAMKIATLFMQKSTQIRQLSVGKRESVISKVVFSR